MKKYIKYLITKPSRLFGLVFIHTFSFLMIRSIFYNAGELVENNSVYSVTFLFLLTITTPILIQYHSYKEYKDGLN